MDTSTVDNTRQSKPAADYRRCFTGNVTVNYQIKTEQHGHITSIDRPYKRSPWYTL